MRAIRLMYSPFDTLFRRYIPPAYTEMHASIAKFSVSSALMGARSLNAPKIPPMPSELRRHLLILSDDHFSPRSIRSDERY